MRKILFFVAAMASLTLASCGGGEDADTADSTEVEATPEPKEVSVTTISEVEGTLGELVTISEGTYNVNFTPDKYIKDNFDGLVAIPMTVKQLEELTDGKFINDETFELIFLDENGFALPLKKKFEMQDEASFINALRANGDTKITVDFGGSWIEKSDVDAIISKAKAVKLSLSGRVDEYGGLSVQPSADSETNNRLFSSDDPDEMYSEYVDVAMELEGLETDKENGDDVDMDRVKELFAKADKMKPEIQKIKGKLNSGNQGALSSVNDMISRCKRTLK